MIAKMTLLSDSVFGNGMSVPGAEDISVLCDKNGFPYYKGSTFKGIFREELERLLGFKGMSAKDIEKKLSELLGKAGDDEKNEGKIIFSDFGISRNTKERVLAAINLTGNGRKSDSADGKRWMEIRAITTNVRTFTAIDDDGIVKKGSLRMARCVDKGLSFYSRIECPEKEQALIEETLGMIKWIGTMRNRGFGHVKISVVTEAE